MTKNRSFAVLLLLPLALMSLLPGEISMKVVNSITVDSLGACQGISWQNGTIYLYGDREVGVIRKYRIVHGRLSYRNAEYRLTLEGKDLINHPTGIAYNGTGPTFIGNTTKLPGSGDLWKAEIFCVNWKGLQKSGTLDGNVINRIDDDACIQGARPEYVRLDGKWYVATADYGNRGNEVRLYYPDSLKKAKHTSDPGLLYKKFTCSPWVQNLYWIQDKGLLVLIENEGPGRKWRFTYVDLKRSVELGKQFIVKEISVQEKSDELEGYSLLGNDIEGIAVSSSKKDNITFTSTSW